MYPVVDHEKCSGYRNCGEIYPSEVYKSKRINPILSAQKIASKAWPA
jgi:ferredoxin